MFLETSCLVAIVVNEADAADISGRLQRAHHAITAPHVLLETVMALSTRKKLTPSEVLGAIEDILAEANVEIVPLTAEIARAAIGAFARYGKGRGHASQLNFGDCLSYGCARVHGAPMLFKGEDFAQTDIARV